jgi:hypothetical protein
MSTDWIAVVIGEIRSDIQRTNAECDTQPKYTDAYGKLLSHKERQFGRLERILKDLGTVQVHDQQMKDLIALAVNNGANENEASNAAMEVCRRLWQKMGESK